MDLIIGKNGYGTMLAPMERSTHYAIIRKLLQGKNAQEVAKAVVAIGSMKSSQLSLTTAASSQMHTIGTEFNTVSDAFNMKTQNKVEPPDKRVTRFSISTAKIFNYFS